MRQIATEGLYHADPHRGNVLLMPDARLALLDFGLLGRLDDDTRQTIALLLLAVAQNRADDVAALIVEVSLTDLRSDEPGFAHELRRKLPRFASVNSAAESKALVERDAPAVIVASSGMATGGRVVHHLAAGLPDPRNTVLFVGFQAAGTRGRQLVDGARHVKIFGQYVPVHARIEKTDGMSAHADAGEIIRWLRTFPRAPKTTYLVHGEIVAQEALKARIAKELGWNVEIPAHGQKADLPL